MQTAAIEARPRPLEGLKVVEVGVWYAGPGGGAILADLGAEVIKLEAIDGDQCRLTGVSGPLRTGEVDRDDWTVLYDLGNRGKKSVSVDLRQLEGQKILHRLVATADVFITNLRSSTKPKMGIDYDTLVKIKPDLIYASVTGFGPKGELSDQGAFDNLGQAMSGMMYVVDPDEPKPLSFILLDQFTGIATSHAVLTGLVSRQLHGRGQALDISLLGSGYWLFQPNLVVSSVLGKNIDTSWKRRHHSPLRNVLKAGDGKWMVGTNHPEPKTWPIFCAALGCPELVEDPRFVSEKDRFANVEQLNAVIDEILLERSRDEWLDILVNQNGLKFMPVLTAQEALASEQAVANKYLQDLQHPILGSIRVPSHPVGFSASAPPEVRPAPIQIGQDTLETLQCIGYSSDEIGDLARRRIVRLAR